MNRPLLNLSPPPSPLPRAAPANTPTNRPRRILLWLPIVLILIPSAAIWPITHRIPLTLSHLTITDTRWSCPALTFHHGMIFFNATQSHHPITAEHFHAQLRTIRLELSEFETDVALTGQADRRKLLMLFQRKDQLRATWEQLPEELRAPPGWHCTRSTNTLAARHRPLHPDLWKTLWVSFHHTTSPTDTHSHLSLPTPLLAFASTLPLLFASTTSLLLRRRRKQIGLCRACGYDLRATPTRCPECGHEPVLVQPETT